MKRMTVALAGLFVAVAVAQPAAAQDKKAEKAPIRAQKILVDNDRVRVSESVFKPGEANPMMKRGYRVTRVLKGNTTVERITDGKKEVIEYKEGAVFVAPAGMTSTKNIGKGEVTIYTVVLKPE